MPVRPYLQSYIGGIRVGAILYVCLGSSNYFLKENSRLLEVWKTFTYARTGTLKTLLSAPDLCGCSYKLPILFHSVLTGILHMTICVHSRGHSDLYLYPCCMRDFSHSKIRSTSYIIRAFMWLRRKCLASPPRSVASFPQG